MRTLVVLLLLTHSLTLVVVKFHILTTIIIQIKCLSFYGDTLNLYFHTDCIMILWSSQSTMIVSWYNGFQYQKWKRHEMGLFSCTFHASMILDMCTECIMILSSSESTLNVSWYNQGKNLKYYLQIVCSLENRICTGTLKRAKNLAAACLQPTEVW